jgi:hypothetical protein
LTIAHQSAATWLIAIQPGKGRPKNCIVNERTEQTIENMKIGNPRTPQPESNRQSKITISPSQERK